MQKKKEELEFELDVIEKSIARITNKMKDQGNVIPLGGMGGMANGGHSHMF